MSRHELGLHLLHCNNCIASNKVLLINTPRNSKYCHRCSLDGMCSRLKGGSSRPTIYNNVNQFPPLPFSADFVQYVAIYYRWAFQPVVSVVMDSSPLGMLGFFTSSDKAMAWTLNSYITFGRRPVTLSLVTVEMKVSTSSWFPPSWVAKITYSAMPGCPILEGRCQQRRTHVAPKLSTLKSTGMPGATKKVGNRAEK